VLQNIDNGLLSLSGFYLAFSCFGFGFNVSPGCSFFMSVCSFRLFVYAAAITKASGRPPGVEPESNRVPDIARSLIKLQVLPLGTVSRYFTSFNLIFVLLLFFLQYGSAILPFLKKERRQESNTLPDF
jgi:hypothetical protein